LLIKGRQVEKKYQSARSQKSEADAKYIAGQKYEMLAIAKPMQTAKSDAGTIPIAMFHRRRDFSWSVIDLLAFSFGATPARSLLAGPPLFRFPDMMKFLAEDISSNQSI
jgi:hypothetical protein